MLFIFQLSVVNTSLSSDFLINVLAKTTTNDITNTTSMTMSNFITLPTPDNHTNSKNISPSSLSLSPATQPNAQKKFKVQSSSVCETPKICGAHFVRLQKHIYY